MKRFRLWILEDLRNRAERGYYLVQYKPRILYADDEFPLEFPEVRGRSWPLTDWLATI